MTITELSDAFWWGLQAGLYLILVTGVVAWGFYLCARLFQSLTS
jgi:hypothetical protein